MTCLVLIIRLYNKFIRQHHFGISISLLFSWNNWWNQSDYLLNNAQWLEIRMVQIKQVCQILQIIDIIWTFSLRPICLHFTASRILNIRQSFILQLKYLLLVIPRIKNCYFLILLPLKVSHNMCCIVMKRV